MENCLKECWKHKNHNTKVQTDAKAIFITYNKLFRVAAIDSMRRWVIELFIETSILKKYIHSCRLAATGKASYFNVDIAKILKQVCCQIAKKF